jgi:diguanylate cyclase (GGDEF)-like protein
MREALLGQTYDSAAWMPFVADERFVRRGAYFFPEGSVDWDAAELGAHYKPDVPPDPGGDAWRPGDELFVPCRDSEGRVLAIVSLGDPVSGRRPCDAEIDFVVAVGMHAAFALETVTRAVDAERHRAALAELLGVSSKLAGHDSIESTLQAVCDGVRSALGFGKVIIELRDPESGRLVPHASVGWPAGQEPRWEIDPATVGPLLDPEFEVGGCYLLPAAAARARAPHEYGSFRSELNGRGPHAWNRHWLFVPLRDAGGDVVGRIWADDPQDRLLPSRPHLEALAVFANQATMAIHSAGQLEQLRALADRDPLTGLFNRRAFMRELAQEVARAQRYGRPLTVVLCDVDHFKLINDTHGHPEGDRALCRLAAVLGDCLRTSDDAYRIGGDEFALLLPETTPDGAADVTRRLEQGLREGGAPRVSCGVASLLPGDADGEALIRKADAELYSAKRARSAPGALSAAA